MNEHLLPFRPLRLLTIAGSDSGGGAGLQADLKTFAAFGHFGMSAVTAVTAQNTLGVTEVQALADEMVEAQIQAVAQDIGLDGVKTGMLATAELVACVVKNLPPAHTPLVVDPVMVAKGGHPLLQADAVAAVRTLLLPKAHLITPNLPEAAVLMGVEAPRDEEGCRALALALLQLGPQAVLLKGGHLEGHAESPDHLAWRGPDGPRWRRFSAPRVATSNSHGTGCTLSAALVCGLAEGLPVAEAVGRAKDYLTGALKGGAAWRLGAGHGPVDHNWRWRRTS